MKKAHSIDKDAVFAAWAEERSQGVARPLNDWIAAYPACKEDLIIWTSTAPVFQAAEAMQVDAEADARTAEIGRRLVAAWRAAAETPVTSLLAAARAQGMTDEMLATHVGISQPIAIKLERRLLRFVSLPAILIERLAQTLSLSQQQVRDYLNQSPRLAAGARYKSDRAPQASPQQEFSQAVQNCKELPEEQRRFWLATNSDDID